MSDSSRTQVRIYKESAWGETPSTGNKMTDLNVVSENLSQQTTSERSKNIRSDTNTSNVNRTGVNAQGDIGVEMNFGSGLELLMAGVMRGAFATDAGITANTTVAAVASGNHFTSTAQFGNIVVGQFIKVSGFSTAANNGYFRVIAKASSSDIQVEGGTLVNESAGPAITIKGSVLKNSTTNQSFLVEVQRADIASTFKYFTGMRVGQNQFNFAPNSLVNGSFNLMGKQMFTATATQGDGSPNAAATTRSMNSVDNIQGVFKDAALTTLDITNFSFSVNPSLRPQPAIGNLANVGIGSGTINVQITLEAYLENRTFLEEYLNFTETALALAIQDVAGNAYVFDFPACVPVSGEDNTGGLDQDVLQRFTYEAFLDTTSSATGIITKISA